MCLAMLIALAAATYLKPEISNYMVWPLIYMGWGSLIFLWVGFWFPSLEKKNRWAIEICLFACSYSLIFYWRLS